MHRPLKRVEDALKPFREIKIEEADKGKTLDEFELLLNASELDSAEVYRYARRQKYAAMLMLMAGFFMFVAALAIIFIPLPKYLEIKTLYYFNPDDGITVSDIIALIILFAGIWLMVFGVFGRKRSDAD